MFHIGAALLMHAAFLISAAHTQHIQIQLFLLLFFVKMNFEILVGDPFIFQTANSYKKNFYIVNLKRNGIFHYNQTVFLSSRLIATVHSMYFKYL